MQIFLEHSWSFHIFAKRMNNSVASADARMPKESRETREQSRASDEWLEQERLFSRARYRESSRVVENRTHPRCGSLDRSTERDRVRIDSSASRDARIGRVDRINSRLGETTRGSREIHVQRPGGTIRYSDTALAVSAGEFKDQWTEGIACTGCWRMRWLAHARGPPRQGFEMKEEKRNVERLAFCQLIRSREIFPFSGMKDRNKPRCSHSRSLRCSSQLVHRLRPPLRGWIRSRKERELEK